MKRFFAILVVFTLLLGAFAIPTFAEDAAAPSLPASGELANYSWTIDADGTLTVTCDGDMALPLDVDVVPWINGDYAGRVKSVVVAEGATSVAAFAFAGCETIESVSLPASIESIGFGAFLGTGLMNDESNWEDGALYIGNCLIACDPLTTGVLTVKDGTTVIADGAAAFCTDISGVILPEGISAIPDGCFVCCSGLDGVEIPESVTSIGAVSFALCSSLADVTVPDGVTSIGEGAFLFCPELKLVTVGSGVESIGACAFGFDPSVITDIIAGLGDMLGGLGDESFDLGDLSFDFGDESFDMSGLEDLIGGILGGLGDISGDDLGGLGDLFGGLLGGLGDESFDMSGLEDLFGGILGSLGDLFGDLSFDAGDESIDFGDLSFDFGDESFDFGDESFDFGDFSFDFGDESFDFGGLDDPLGLLDFSAFSNDIKTVYVKSADVAAMLTSADAAGGLIANADTVIFGAGVSAPDFVKNSYAQSGESAVVSGCTWYRNTDGCTVHCSSGNGVCIVCGEGLASIGDPNGDGVVNNIDASLVLQYDSGLVTLRDVALAAADVNGDGAANNIDASVILQLDSGVINAF